MNRKKLCNVLLAMALAGRAHDSCPGVERRDRRPSVAATDATTANGLDDSERCL